MIRHIGFRGIGPFGEIDFQFGRGTNLLTGDNGLGKSFVLENIWWALTNTWSNTEAKPYVEKGKTAQIEFDYFDRDETIHGKLNRAGNNWLLQKTGSQPPSCLVLYAKADCSVSVWDPVREPGVLHFTPKDILHGLRKGVQVSCNGLISDWVTWQDRATDQFHSLCEALNTLSPQPEEKIRPGKPVRPTIGDTRDLPTLEFGYGRVPITHASSGMRRVVSFAYLLVWWIYENRFATEILSQQPTEHVVILFDEIEAHLHPQWQRVFIPALLAVTRHLLPKINATVQLIATTHAPLVLASVEPSFDTATDTVHTFQLAGGEVRVRNAPWAKQGDASNWLVSESFGLEQARSKEAEIAIEAAEAFMRGDLKSLPGGLRTEQSIHAELSRVLASHDDFWPRWIVSTQYGARR
ncbi:MAG: hypothetical protein RLZZ536_1405 [Planctomycetota bacterium]|jgi:hypothetical protein